MRKKIKKILFILSFGFLLIIGIIVGLFFQFKAQFNDQKILAELHKKDTFPTSEFVPFEEKTIHASFVGNKSLPKVLLIHGSPGYWSDFKNIFADSILQKQFCLISFDRAGYGKTEIPAQESLEKQAEITAAVIKHFCNQEEKVMILGHSFGGAVLQQTLLDFPHLISKAIYVAPCLSPKYQKAKWYNIAIKGGLTNKIMPHELRSSNLEMMALSEQLAQNEERLAEIDIPTHYIQGKKDVLVPYKTLDYYKQHHKNISYLLLDDLNHFVPWSKPQLMINTIQQMHQAKD
jgi:pimeloyl-ACP methyl ester carboxylesterase